MTSKPSLEDALVSLFESWMQAPDDFCGEQREWHLPRLTKAATDLIQLFPQEAARALERAKSPYD